MNPLKILFLTHKGEGLVGAPQTFHEFEQAVGKLADCEWAGAGWHNHREGETVDEAVKRVMPDADWVFADRDNGWKTPPFRNYRVGAFISDLHGKHNMGIGTPEGFLSLINKAKFDAVFVKYAELHGFPRINPKRFLEELECPFYFLPWSIDVAKHHLEEKNIDAVASGSRHASIYPLRHSMWNNVVPLCKGYKVVRAATPGGGTYGRVVSKLKATHYVGERYTELLNHAKTLLFDSSIYRYPVQKYFEGAASECLLLCDEPSNAKELGFIDNETYVKVGLNDWRQKLLYCLENYDGVKYIAEAAAKNMVERHSHEVRAKEFLEALR